MDASPLFGNPVDHWREWFAWYPVQTYNAGWRWLQTVAYRRIQKHPYLDGGADFWWQYRAK